MSNVIQITVKQDAEGRFSLNDLHAAASREIRQLTKEWLKGQNTSDLIEQLEK